MNQESDFKNGDRIFNDKFEIEALIGEGEFTRVYRARRLESGEIRALKVTVRGAPGLTKAVFDQYRERFRLEVQLAARLSKQDNPHLLQVYDFGELDDRLYLEMEYAAGGNLQDRIDAGPLPIDEAVRIALEAAEGLEGLHRISAIHRNIKPSNILFDADGVAKVADWGLAQVPKRKSVQPEAAARAASHPGTPEYMSPEQALTTVYLTPSSDVYSLGCVLFEMLTGRLWQDAMVMVESARELRPEVSPSLEGVLWKMLRKKPGQQRADAADPNKRYLTMDPVRMGLIGILFDEALNAANVAQWEKAEELLDQVLLRVPDYERDGRRASIVQANVRRHLAQARLKAKAGDEAPLPPPPKYVKPIEPAAPAVSVGSPWSAEAVVPAGKDFPTEEDSEAAFGEEAADLPTDDWVSPVSATQEMEVVEAQPADLYASQQHTVPFEEVEARAEAEPVRPTRPVQTEADKAAEPVRLSWGGTLRLVGLIVIFVWLCVVTTPAVSLWAFNTLQDEYQIVLLPGLFGEEPTPTATPFTPSPTASPTATPTDTPMPSPTPTLTPTFTPIPLEIGMPLAAESALTATLGTTETLALSSGVQAITATGSLTEATFLTTTEIITAGQGLTDTERVIMKKTVINTDNFTGTVNVGVVWVRMGPSPDFKAVAKQERGALLRLLGRNEDSTWLKIKMADEQEGWVDARYVDTSAPIELLIPAESPPTPTPRPTEPPTPTPAATAPPSETPVEPQATPTPAMKYPAPVVIGPPDGTVWTDGEMAVHFLEWEPLNLAPDEFYNVTFIYQKYGETQYFGVNTLESRYRLPPGIYQLQADRGEYQWNVVVRQNTSGERGKLDGPPISPESEQHNFTWR